MLTNFFLSWHQRLTSLSILQSRPIRILSCVVLSLDQPRHLGARLCGSFTGNGRSSGSRWRKLISLKSQCNWPAGGWLWWRGSEGICRSVFVGLDAFPSLVPGGKQLPGRGSANGEKVAQSGSTVVGRPTRWSLLFTFGFLIWSSISQIFPKSNQQRNIV